MQVEVRAVETFVSLLFAVGEGEEYDVFYDRLCEAACKLAEMDRAAVFVSDSTLRRVRVVGSHGIAIDAFRHLHVQVDDAPLALRALSEDRVLEATDGFADLLPPEYEQFLDDVRLVCTPISAAGHWPGVILSTRARDRPLTDEERHVLWSFGKIAALAASARVATRAQLRARQLQERIDLAREVHDRVIQRLFGVSLALAGDQLPVEQRKRCADEIHEALTDLRMAVQRPLGPRSAQPETSVAEEVELFREARPDIDVEFEMVGDVPRHLETLTHAVITEALRNALKHADPTCVAVRVVRDGAFVLTVVNDGVPPNARRRPGMGLRLAAVEALQLGGIVEFGPDGDGRWRVRLIVSGEEGR